MKILIGLSAMKVNQIVNELFYRIDFDNPQIKGKKGFFRDERCKSFFNGRTYTPYYAFKITKKIEGGWFETLSDVLCFLKK
jgi:hypothetical protein